MPYLNGSVQVADKIAVSEIVEDVLAAVPTNSTAAPNTTTTAAQHAALSVGKVDSEKDKDSPVRASLTKLGSDGSKAEAKDDGAKEEGGTGQERAHADQPGGAAEQIQSQRAPLKLRSGAVVADSSHQDDSAAAAAPNSRAPSEKLQAKVVLLQPEADGAAQEAQAKAEAREAKKELRLTGQTEEQGESASVTGHASESLLAGDQPKPASPASSRIARAKRNLRLGRTEKNTADDTEQDGKSAAPAESAGAEQEAVDSRSGVPSPPAAPEFGAAVQGRGKSSKPSGAAAPAAAVPEGAADLDDPTMLHAAAAAVPGFLLDERQVKPAAPAPERQAELPPQPVGARGADAEAPEAAILAARLHSSEKDEADGGRIDHEVGDGGDAAAAGANPEANGGRAVGGGRRLLQVPVLQYSGSMAFDQPEALPLGNWVVRNGIRVPAEVAEAADRIAAQKHKQVRIW